ncbi:MAG TPA: VWA domain-containing protein [Terriglobales bacterium]|nr:VWA domain-containing protein [Terriglobales bacterium]
MSILTLRLRARHAAVISLLCLLFAVIALSIASAQTSAASAPASSQSASNPSQEITSHDELTTFKVNVNLVLVRVVVRNSHGNAVGNLRQEDFELFDNRKPQVIKHFAMEQSSSKSNAAPPEPPKSPDNPNAPLPPPIAPTHYVAYVFDDVHIAFGDLAHVRDAALHHLGTLTPTDRAAIFTTSGQGNLDFTDDRDKLRQALNGITPRPVARSTGISSCPDVPLYLADLIVNKRDPTATDVATYDALHCAYQDQPQYMSAAAQLAESTAQGVLQAGEHESRLSLTVLKEVVRRIAVMPGQRTVLLLSPGFLTPELEYEYDEVGERALRSQVMISALNARGLYAPMPLGDASTSQRISPVTQNQRMLYETAAATADEDVLAALTYETGGVLFHNNNDFDEGFRLIAAPPEYSYVLGFSPQNLKLDGKFHSLKVTVKDPPKLDIQARKGYYAPKHVADPAEEAKQEIEEALFSQEELHDLPVDLHTQFFKSSDIDAKLAVLVHVDVKRMHFHKAEGRNQGNLTVVSGLFDRNGKFITGSQKIIDMHLKDDTLANKLGNGITVKSSFDVKPGSYLVRLVVRDAEGQLSAANGAIEIP